MHTQPNFTACSVSFSISNAQNLILGPCFGCVQLNDLLSLGLHRVWKRAAVKWSGAARGHSALDVCCGSGDLAFRLAVAVGEEGRVRAAPSLGFKECMSGTACFGGDLTLACVARASESSGPTCTRLTNTNSTRFSSALYQLDYR